MLPSPSPLAGSHQRFLYLQVIIAVAAGVIVGVLFPAFGASLKPLGDAFVKLIKMVIAPVIFLTVCTGIAGMADLKQTGRIAGKAMLYFLCFSTLALVIGMVVANVVRPGAGMHIHADSLDTRSVSQFISAAQEHHSFSDFLLQIIPSTTAGAFTSGEILQVLLVAILFGISLARMGTAGETVLNLFRSLTEMVFGVVRLVMYLAPVGAFGAMAFTVGKFGIGSVLHLIGLVLAFYLTAILFVGLVLGLVARLAGFSIIRLLAFIKEELLIVLGTSSSESALPGLIAKLEKAGCNQGIVGLVVPMGYSFNLDGTNIYMTLAALFIAQATDIHLSFGEQLALLLVAMVSSKGAAGVTGAGFITLAATLSVVPSVPVGGMALILGVDRFMSECRSLTNLIGNAVAAIVIARWENALDDKKLYDALHGQAVADILE
ncbi:MULTISPECIES: dicarboxylate/amino acid:cation symporter [Acetobacter]|uniref:C4-dicarboxylate transport protein n=1 Tax=Acetobacter peroxydans TaxID=104098 RepID=A0A4Y3TUE7_9PROT|nr:dicarboxylate/amino acid:cation symporter [Acetobacter peroxydans]MCH4143851.1 dicarboxylate/amino acid:cation symporter [Acetobacter peroxydans]MCI1395049.1 dicarboxylate/amino acid:cation symporter [Acetobacter peroxydans]MCI1411350.1 dicarboxylate/amino acid:cation symporter [Acetobacter peroxydans]MCI1440031.1 dicarboxylate/amino acid:cation symporter [Acetobacter peroxydans]MCI1566447.1 dicarboxylate/amino acid:cation symporter [Acetobacter peroxydans]